MDRPLGQVQQLDQKMNEAGLLRLMTEKSLVQNMSNRIPQEYKKSQEKPQKSALKNLPIIKKILLGIHDKIFKMYFEN